MRILVVEDSAINLTVLTGIIARIPGTSVVGKADPRAALDLCRGEIFDIVLVDYTMPGINGVDFIRALRADPRSQHVPIVMITADSNRAVRLEAVEAGATDFLQKPVDPHELQVRVGNLMTLRQAQLDLADRAIWLAREVDKATANLLAREEEMIWRLARAIETRDGGTGDHISRVAVISRMIAEQLGLDPRHCRDIYVAAPLHDVGKIGVPDAILNKPGRLSPEERAEVERHVTFGEEILRDGTSDLLRVAERIAASHHERWDGTGYPHGLAGTKIPLEGRIVAVADVFEALCTPRPYKCAWTPEDARREILAQSGRHFDPACVAAFDAAWDRIRPVIDDPDTPAASAA